MCQMAGSGLAKDLLGYLVYCIVPLSATVPVVLIQVSSCKEICCKQICVSESLECTTTGDGVRSEQIMP